MNAPRKDDAVKGGNNPQPRPDDAVLGGKNNNDNDYFDCTQCNGKNCAYEVDTIFWACSKCGYFNW